MDRNKIVSYFLYLVLSTLFLVDSSAQAPMPPMHAGEVQLELEHLNVLGSVLYIAAHPDDENTRLLAYLARGKGYRTGYLSLTRGDGGQNLIGDEKGSLLGLLRTQELLAARRIDGAEQLFSRAIDFGYSKTPEETMEIWDRDKILADVVWAVRKFRPDVMITRFAEPDRGGGGHGHHTYSAMLAREAFHLAADPKAYPEQLEFVEPWQPKRLFWNLYTWRFWKPDEKDKPHISKINIDEYNPLLGKGYGEIAAEARSMHKCQAFGTAKLRGTQTEQLLQLEGEPILGAEPFTGIDISWDRVDDGKEIKATLDRVNQNFNAANMAEVVPDLLTLYQLLTDKEGYWYEVKRRDLKGLIARCAGLYLEVNSTEFQVAQGDTLALSASVINRGNYPIHLSHIDWGISGKNSAIDSTLKRGTLYDFKRKHVLSASEPITQPYWLANPGKKGTFDVANQELIGEPQSPAASEAELHFLFGREKPVYLTFKTPVVHKYVDRAVGELYRPYTVTPPLTANVSKKAFLFSKEEPQEVQIVLSSLMNTPQSYTLQFEVPEGWEVTPSSLTTEFQSKGEEKLVSLTITPPSGQSIGSLKVKNQAGETLLGKKEIAYGHIPVQTVFPLSNARLIKLDIEKRGEKVAYLVGSGDEVPTSLEQIGYQVDILEEDAVIAKNLSSYDAVIAGIRLYNTRDRVAFLQNEILKYVYAGGTYIVQYNTSRGLKTEDIGPYPLKLSRGRVTNEEAPVKMLQPDHPVFNFPNKITDQDFEGWVQERGLYFPEEWNEAYTPLLEMADPGEDPQQGSLLVAKYGEGYFVYSGISWFRELPAGVPGAFRLFANLVSLGKAEISEGEMVEERKR